MWHKKQKSWQEEELVKHSEDELDETSGNKNSCRQQCDQYIDSNINHHEPEDDIETTSGKNNDHEEQQKSTRNNKKQKNDNGNEGKY